MGIDVIKCWEHGCKDYNILGDNYYFDNGQGCGTLWFPDYQTMRRFQLVFGELNAKDFFLCARCKNRDKNNSEDFACGNLKDAIVKFAKIGTLLLSKDGFYYTIKAIGKKIVRLELYKNHGIMQMSTKDYKEAVRTQHFVVKD